MNNLEEIYEEYRVKSQNIAPELRERLSAPLLLKPSERWLSASRRILLVGQETFQWSFFKNNPEFLYYSDRWTFSPMRSMDDFSTSDDAVPAMMSAYEFFCFSEFQRSNRNSPFWRFYRDLREINGENPFGFETSVLWTNLYRQDFNGGPLSNANLDIQNKVSTLNDTILSDEIFVLRPTDVIFCTGPNYDNELSRQFDGVIYENVAADIDDRAFSKLSHPKLPVNSWRIYHPNYMQRARQDLWQKQLDILRDSAVM